MNKRLLVSSISTLLMCVSIVSGATYALFTSESKVNVAVTSGTVSVVATAENLTLSSSLGSNLPQTAARLEGNNVILDKFVPGDKAEFDLVIENMSDINVNYQTIVSLVDGVDLFKGLVVTLTEGTTSQVYDGMTAYSNWELLQPVTGTDKVVKKVHVSIELPEERGNEYQGLSTKLSFVVKAVQGNANVSVENDPNTNYIYTASDLQLFEDAANNGNKFKGKTVKVMNDIDMAGREWDPIVKFNGTFDGGNHTISNLTIEGTSTVGMFANPYSATIQNVKLDNVSVFGNHFVGTLVGYMVGHIKNCHVTNSTVIAVPNAVGDTFDNGDKVGGLVGYGYPGTDGTFIIDGCSATNVSVTAYRDIGGLIGLADAEDVTNCSVQDITLTVDQVTNFYGEKTINANYLVGRIYDSSTLDVSNTVSGENSVSIKKAASTDAALDNAINAALSNNDNVEIVLGAGTYTLPSNTTATATIAIKGDEDTVIDLTMGAYLEKANLSFDGVTIKGSTGYANGGGSDYAALYSRNIEYTNCHFDGAFRVGRDGAKFVDCTFDLKTDDKSGGYVWAYGNDVEFIGCTFETDGKALLLYSDGPHGDNICTAVVKDCTFNSTCGNKAGAIANQNCAAIEIDNYGNGVNLTTSGNTYDSNFSGEWRIKSYNASKYSVTVNGTKYTSLALDGRTMTINSSKEVSFN